MYNGLFFFCWAGILTLIDSMAEVWFVDGHKKRTFFDLCLNRPNTSVVLSVLNGSILIQSGYKNQRFVARKCLDPSRTFCLHK